MNAVLNKYSIYRGISQGASYTHLFTRRIKTSNRAERTTKSVMDVYHFCLLDRPCQGFVVHGNWSFTTIPTRGGVTDEVVKIWK